MARKGNIRNEVGGFHECLRFVLNEATNGLAAAIFP
jgi:hypothetical protein